VILLKAILNVLQGHMADYAGDCIFNSSASGTPPDQDLGHWMFAWFSVKRRVGSSEGRPSRSPPGDGDAPRNGTDGNASSGHPGNAGGGEGDGALGSAATTWGGSASEAGGTSSDTSDNVEAGLLSDGSAITKAKEAEEKEKVRQAAITKAKEAVEEEEVRQAAITKAKEDVEEEKPRQATIAKAKEAEEEEKARQAAIAKSKEAEEKEKARQATIAKVREGVEKKKALQAAIAKTKEAEKAEKALQAASAKAKDTEKEAKAHQAAITKAGEAEEKERARRPRSPSSTNGDAANYPGEISLEGAFGAPSDTAGVVLGAAGAVGDCMGAAPFGVDDPPVTLGAAWVLYAGDAAVSAGPGDTVALAQDPASLAEPATLATVLASNATGAGDGMDSAPQPAFVPAASGVAFPTGTTVERLEPARAATSQSPLMDPASTGRLVLGDTKEPEEVDDDEYGSSGVQVAPLVTVLEPEPPAAAGGLVPEARGRSDAKEVERKRIAARLAMKLAARGQQRDQPSAPSTQSESCLDQEKN